LAPIAFPLIAIHRSGRCQNLAVQVAAVGAALAQSAFPNRSAPTRSTRHWWPVEEAEEAVVGSARFAIRRPIAAPYPTVVAAEVMAAALVRIACHRLWTDPSRPNLSSTAEAEAEVAEAVDSARSATRRTAAPTLAVAEAEAVVASALTVSHPVAASQSPTLEPGTRVDPVPIAWAAVVR
jgi:hypothetical protein